MLAWRTDCCRAYAGATRSAAKKEMNSLCCFRISYPEDAATSATKIRYADMAMYHAKENGRNNFQFFNVEISLKALERQSIEGDLRRALERGEFLSHYQPKVNLETLEITTAEALIRWQQPEQGLVPRSQFVRKSRSIRRRYLSRRTQNPGRHIHGLLDRRGIAQPPASEISRTAALAPDFSQH